MTEKNITSLQTDRGRMEDYLFWCHFWMHLGLTGATLGFWLLVLIPYCLGVGQWYARKRASMFEDAETGRSVYVDPAVARGPYRERFRAHQRGLEQIAAQHGVDLIQWTTDRPLVECLVEYVQARGRRGRTVLRRTAGRSR